MAKMSGAVTLFFVLFLHYWRGTEPHHLHLIQGLNNEIPSSSKTLDEGVSKIFDEILHEVFSKDPNDAPLGETGAAGRSEYPQQMSLRSAELASSLDKEKEHLAKIVDEILHEVFSKAPNDAPLGETAAAGRSGNSVSWNSPESEYFLGSVDEISNNGGVPCERGLDLSDWLLMNRTWQKCVLLHGLDHKRHCCLAVLDHSGESQLPCCEDTQAVLRRVPGGKELSPPAYSQQGDHISDEKRDQESSLFNRDVIEQLTTVDKETLQVAVSPDAHYGNMPCAKLLHFLQRNIIVAVGSVAAILTAAVLLLLLMTMYCRKKQLLHSPEHITYNIFIMNEEDLRKHAGKRLKCDSYV